MSTSFKSVHGILSICTPPRQREGFHSTQLGVPAKQQRTSARFLFSTPRTASSRRRTPADRFIPTRLGQNSEFSSHALTRTISKSRDRLDRAGIEDDLQENALQEQLLELEGCSSDTRVLNFTPVKSKPSEQYNTYSDTKPWFVFPSEDYWDSPVLSPSLQRKRMQKRTKIPKSAEKVLDAPNIVNDFCKSNHRLSRLRTLDNLWSNSSLY